MGKVKQTPEEKKPEKDQEVEDAPGDQCSRIKNGLSLKPHLWNKASIKGYDLREGRVRGDNLRTKGQGVVNKLLQPGAFNNVTKFAM